jgi:hypothetical protein
MEKGIMVSQKLKRILCIALVLIAFIVPFASAEVLHPELVDMNKTITFSDLGLTGQEDVQIWQGTTLIERGNTSGADILYQPLGDYLVVTRPTLTSRWLNNPALLLYDLMDYLTAFIFPIFVILGFAAILIGLSRYGRR